LGAYDVVARFAGAIAAWIFVSVILISTSAELGLIVLIACRSRVADHPIMRPLHTTQAAQREAAGRLAALGSDTVAGLRILRASAAKSLLEQLSRQSNLVRLRQSHRIAQAGLESGQVSCRILTAVVTYSARRTSCTAHSNRSTRGLLRLRDLLTTPLRTLLSSDLHDARVRGAGRVLRS